MPPLHRYLGNPVLSAIGRLFFGSPAAISTAGCGRSAAMPIRGLDLQTSGHGVRQRDGRQGDAGSCGSAEVPTTLSPDRAHPPAAPAQLAGRLAAPALPASVQPAWLFLYPGLVLMAIGVGVHPRPAAWTPDDPWDPVRRTHDGLRQRADHHRLPGNPVRRFRPRLLDDRRLPAPSVVDRAAGRPLGLGGRPSRRAALVLAGLVLHALIALLISRAIGIDRLNYRDTLRIVIPASTLLMLGVQTVLASFFPRFSGSSAPG